MPLSLRQFKVVVPLLRGRLKLNKWYKIGDRVTIKYRARFDDDVVPPLPEVRTIMDCEIIAIRGYSKQDVQIDVIEVSFYSDGRQTSQRKVLEVKDILAIGKNRRMRRILNLNRAA